MNYTNYNKSKKEQTASPLKYPQGYFKDKKCKICSKVFSPIAPSEHYCSDACKDYSIKDKFLKRNYGISLATYNEMLIEQNNKCAICGSDGIFTTTVKGTTTPLVVDHCHSTGNIRGLLCHTCNTAIGQLHDSKDLLLKAIAYLENTSNYITPVHYNVKVRSTNTSNTTALLVLIDHLSNNVPRTELITKYDLTEGTVKGIIELKTQQAKKAKKRYDLMIESATTIPKGSTSEANADGSGSCQIDNDIVSSI